MNRSFTSFPVTDFNTFKSKMLNWANQFNICCFLDNHDYNISPHTYECLLAIDAQFILESNAGEAFDQLKRFSELHDDWLFGHFGYDLKNEIETLSSSRFDGIEFPDLFFFVPKIIIRLEQGKVSIGSGNDDTASILENILATSLINFQDAPELTIDIRQRFSMQEYLQTIKQLQEHILRGDCYEINFCQEFFAENVSIDPIELYKQLEELSPNPFSCYYKLNHRYLVCASPERYLKKTGSQLLSQPIKGTITRNEDSMEDDLNRERLALSLKERTENVMIVDLVRNDLSRVCKEGTVLVSELFGIYAFPQVYQMISTITGEIDAGIHWVNAIKSSFPMGSMTGAPKKKVMELIEKYERTKRGIFSGAVGYVTPSRDFDFNVVIRSIMYNQQKKYLSYQAGSGITHYSQPEVEYQECLVKVEAIKKVLTRSVSQHF